MNGRKFFQALLDSQTLNPHALAQRLDAPTLQSTFQRYLDGKTKEVRRSTFEPVANFFKVSVDGFYNPEIATQELMRLGLITDVRRAPGHEMIETSNVAPSAIGIRRVPLISHIQAGLWCEVVDSFLPGDANDWLLTDMDLSSSAFALEIKGLSMLPEFNPGDRVIIDPEVAPLPGDFVAAKNGEEEATFKKYRPRGMDAHGNTIFELVPLNEDFPSMRSDITPIKIVGTMVEHRKYRKRNRE